MLNSEVVNEAFDTEDDTIGLNFLILVLEGIEQTNRIIIEVSPTKLLQKRLLLLMLLILLHREDQLTHELAVHVQENQPFLRYLKTILLLQSVLQFKYVLSLQYGAICGLDLVAILLYLAVPRSEKCRQLSLLFIPCCQHIE